MRGARHLGLLGALLANGCATAGSGNGPEGTDAAIHYIAEILGQFDLVALVELRSDLTDLGRVLPILGQYWDVVYTDWQEDDVWAYVRAKDVPALPAGH